MPERYDASLWSSMPFPQQKKHVTMRSQVNAAYPPMTRETLPGSATEEAEGAALGAASTLCSSDWKSPCVAAVRVLVPSDRACAERPGQQSQVF